MAKHSPAFQLGLDSIAMGDVIIPPLRAYLANPEFRGFKIEVHGIGSRPYDGKFHPSEHPGWPVRALWLYLTAPSLLIKEPIDPSGILAMTAGSIWHAIVERSLLDLGLLVTNELKFEDPSTLSIGRADGLVAPRRGEEHPTEIFELKTMKDVKLRKMTSVEEFIRLNYGYFLQCQEYMRMSGYRKMRFLLMALTFPFEMREFVVEYDMEVATRTADKYRQAIQAAADGDVPMCDGCKTSEGCPARGVCQAASNDQIREWIHGAQA